MNPYDRPKEASQGPRRARVSLGVIRTGLFSLSCLFLAFRDVPHMKFSGLVIGLVLVGMSWGAIHIRLVYWLGVLVSLGLLSKVEIFWNGFQLRAELMEKVIHGGVALPMILGEVMFIAHFFISGRPHK